MEVTDFGIGQLLTSLLPVFLFMLALYLYLAACLMILARKTGTPGAMLAWIPIVNIYLMVKVSGRPGFWFLLVLIPFLGLIFGLIIWMDIAKKRGKPGWWGLLLFVPVIGLIVPAVLAAGPPTTEVAAAEAASTEEDGSLMSCPECGVNVAEVDQFCGECGFNLSEARSSQAATRAPTPSAPPPKSASPAILAVAALALLVLGGLVLAAWMFLGGTGSREGEPPQLPGRMAGTMTEFPVDTEGANPVRPGAVVAQNFEGDSGDQQVNIPENWLPPGMPAESLPTHSAAVTSTTYRSQPSDQPVNVHVLETSKPAAGVEGEISRGIAGSTGGERTGVRVESPKGEIYQGSRIDNGRQVVYVLARQAANVIIVIFAPDPSVRETATRLAGNVGNGQGLNDYPEVRESIWALPPQTPANLSLREMRSFTPDDFGLAELESAAGEQPMSAEARTLLDQVRILVPPRLVAVRYSDPAGGDWGVLMGDYQSGFKSWTAWMLLSTLLSVDSQSVSVGSASGILVNAQDEPLLLFRRQGGIIGIQAPRGTSTESLVQLGVSFW